MRTQEEVGNAGRATIADSILRRLNAETVLLGFIFAPPSMSGRIFAARHRLGNESSGLGLLESIIDASSDSIEMIGADAASYGVDVEIFELCGPILCKAPFDTKAGCDSWPPF